MTIIAYFNLKQIYLSVVIICAVFKPEIIVSRKEKEFPVLNISCFIETSHVERCQIKIFHKIQIIMNNEHLYYVIIHSFIENKM